MAPAPRAAQRAPDPSPRRSGGPRVPGPGRSRRPGAVEAFRGSG